MDPSHLSRRSMPQSKLGLTQTDGPIDLENAARRRRLAGDVCAIFVHAGAGYHSIQNEKIHLGACEEAAKAAMSFLNNGASAVDAVEIAIKVLEDKDITNAGFGSNLTMEGVVECDATVVDHYGRSGAAGAVPCLRNPIQLARLILHHSTQALSLRRVPPNLLVGQGAMEYARDNGLHIYHPDVLISPGAGERYKKWKVELNKAARHSEDQEVNDEDEGPLSMEQQPDAHNLDLAPCWNESQPYSPMLHSPEHSSYLEQGDSAELSAASKKRRHASSHDTPTDGQDSASEYDYESNVDDSFSWPAFRDPKSAHPPVDLCEHPARQHSVTLRPSYSTPDLHSAPPSESSSDTQDETSSGRQDTLDDGRKRFIRDDEITDTVGAIAVDCFGNVAAGSSSGGIGMKHKGRVGPAALVGIGTAVVPAEPDDSNKVSVATVTSGTGEHMATTMAAGSCANRLYTATRRGRYGSSESTDDDSAIRGFVERDFMDHPSVKNSHSAGAIGVLGVKKTTHGIYFYFAHNTDSFAIASMGSSDKEPMSVMSRNKGDGKVMSGGRRIRHRQFPSVRRDTWPDGPENKTDVLGDGQITPRSTKKPRVAKVKGKSSRSRRQSADQSR